MKKLCVLLVVAMLASMCGAFAEETTYSQSPMLDALVESGELAPVEERLPDVPKITDNILPQDLEYECGNYGGTLRTCTASVNWDPDVFCGIDEALLTMGSQNSDVITPNIVEAYEVNEDNTEFIFTLRKGLKWSDGVEVTMEDFEFAINDCVFNTALNPVVSNYFRAGGKANGNPGVFEVIDDTHYKFTFDEPYGGFLVYLSVSGWSAYQDYLKPAHILKQFHPDYAEECHGSLDAYYEFIKPFAAVVGYDDPTAENVWTYVFNQVDMSTWETTDPNDCLTSEFFAGLVDRNFPTLDPWNMISCVNGVTTWERNPYYFKVDAEGQQLPYIDYVTSTYVETVELQQMKYISGEANFGLETCTASYVELYKENEEAGGYTTYMLPYHYSPTDIRINLNYGLNTDGTVKDDDDSKAWREMVEDERFLKALIMCIDADEICDTIYKGLAEPNPNYNCVGDFDGANALLDEMGALDIDGDGYRETPSGLPLRWQIWNRNAATDQVPTCELYVEFFREIGLYAEVYTTDGTLMSTANAANELVMSVDWNHEANLWHYSDWALGNIAPLYNTWINAGGYAGAELDPSEYLAPDEKFTKFYTTMQNLMAVSPSEAVSTVLPELVDIMSNELMGLICPVTNAANIVLLDSDIGNVPTSGLAIALNFSMEQFFFNNPEEN